MANCKPFKQMGERIRSLRLKKGLTQEELGEKAQLHYTYIGQVERGEKTPSLKTLQRLVKALDTQLEYLLEPGSEYETNPEKADFLEQLNCLLKKRSAGEVSLVVRVVKTILEELDQLRASEGQRPGEKLD